MSTQERLDKIETSLNSPEEPEKKVETCHFCEESWSRDDFYLDILCNAWNKVTGENKQRVKDPITCKHTEHGTEVLEALKLIKDAIWHTEYWASSEGIYLIKDECPHNSINDVLSILSDKTQLEFIVNYQAERERLLAELHQQWGQYNTDTTRYLTDSIEIKRSNAQVLVKMFDSDYILSLKTPIEIPDKHYTCGPPSWLYNKNHCVKDHEQFKEWLERTGYKGYYKLADLSPYGSELLK